MYINVWVDGYNGTVVPDYILKVITINKTLHYWIILIISIIAVFGNLIVIRTVICRKYKYLQKTCIISLALSDLLTVVLFATSNLDLLSKPLMTWPFGEFLCYYLPVGQVLGNFASSLALFVIALDRYHNVIHAFSKKWDPGLLYCLLGALALWLVCAGMSYPMSTFYFYIPLVVNNENVFLCSGTSNTKSEILSYYSSINVLFFFPVISMFFWFYYKIALLIWRHRKPVTNERCQEVTDISTTSVRSPVPRIKSIMKKRNLQMERKMRTFKIVVVLIFAFIGCRMPHWLFMLYNLLKEVPASIAWNLRFSFIALNLFNCVLNPFLYTYLGQTIYIFRKINDFMCKICCCCCSNAEFEDYETGQGFMDYRQNENNGNQQNKMVNKSADVKVTFAACLPKYTQKERY
ncbi:somatostatin receptor type 5-like isoform X2 [Sitophilus oryzae]|uniref:Somatostatin receptor type 5-like isoform X2 n=1 Tax=Sitophilus oryzae TaxID=7048 RepID=A0A6J2XYT5_SITOR|nr:somatostatin receptor type 5-like isoform X2 [Sitophilus oryzae]